MTIPNCPECDIQTVPQERKQKVKYKSVKMAINIKVFMCPECEEVFVSDEEQDKYDARVKNFRAKMEIYDKKVSNH